MSKTYTIIDANKKGLNINVKELIQYKDLFFTLAYREFKVRYAQTFLGFLWAFLQPVATLIIFTFIFGKALKIDTGGIPYPVFVLTGMVAWTYFSYVVSQSGKSIITEQAMIQKIYFPRLVIPLSKAVVGFIDFVITFLLLVIMMIFYGVIPSANLIWLPLFILMIIISALAVGIWISALTIRYRDFQHMIPFIIQIGLYATPVAYSTIYVPDKFLLPYYLINPMVGVVEGFRWCIIGQGSPHHYIYYSFIIILILFISSLFYFKKVEKTMADII